MKDSVKDLFSEWCEAKWGWSTLGRATSEIVLIDQEESYGIYDKEKESFIGFRSTQPYSSRKVKFMWNKGRHASAAFNNAFGQPIKNQSRYEVRKR